MDLLLYGRLLAALVSGPMNRDQLRCWVRHHDASSELAHGLQSGAIRRTAVGGVDLDRDRSRAATEALMADLMVTDALLAADRSHHELRDPR